MSNRLSSFHFSIAVLSLFLTLHAEEKVLRGTDSSILPPVKVSLSGVPAFDLRIVPLGIGNESFATREFWLGGRGAGGFKEPPTKCLLAGSMVCKVAGKPDWCVLLGGTEVTVAQWNAVMGLPAPAEAEAAFPIVKISRAEVAVFLEKLNERLKRQPLAQTLASDLGGEFADAFFRLPTEAEWEFAARGGIAVEATTFDKAHPYDAELNRFEWFFGQDSSKGKLKQAGLLKPNPLGLHDMLGNAAELVESIYQVEYSQGRLGGGIVRGGDFRTEEADVRSSKRSEVPWVFPDGSAYRNGAVGFRLALGTLVISSMAGSEKLEAEWADHAQVRAQPGASSPSSAAVSASSAKELEEIATLTQSLAKTLELQPGADLSVQQTLTLMEARTASIRGSMKKADAYFASGAVRLSSIISQDTVTNCAKILQARDILEDPDLTSTVNRNLQEDRIRKLETNLREASISMEGCLKMFGEIPGESVAAAYDEQLKRLTELMTTAEDAETKDARLRQLNATRVARNISMTYVGTRKVDLDLWKNGLFEIAAVWVKALKSE